jgi:hypothetical protein
MPKLAEIIAPSDLVLESIRKIARVTNFHAIYNKMAPVDGRWPFRSISTAGEDYSAMNFRIALKADDASVNFAH